MVDPTRALQRGFNPAKRISGYRAPLTPHLARPRLDRFSGSKSITLAQEWQPVNSGRSGQLHEIYGAWGGLAGSHHISLLSCGSLTPYFFARGTLCHEADGKSVE